MTNAADVAQRFCAAIDHGDWLAITELTDPEWLHDFAAERLERARSLERAPERNENLVPPDAPPEVREWLAGRTTRGLTLSSLAEEIAGIQTAAELETLTPAQIAARALEVLFARAPAEITRTWLGVVSEGDDHAHAVYRARFPSVPGDEGSVGILSMRRTPSGWRVLWDGQGPFGMPGFGPHTYLVARASQSSDPAA